VKTSARAATTALEAYRAKRDFARTSEPKGKPARASEKSRGAYVVQKHRARRLHFDFRLELDGVLKSWAVTKGPSFDPSEKRLAVRTEDHPLEYGSFEGNIPQGEYGGGAVMIWDRGTWIPQNDPKRGLETGHLKFELDGERLKGGFALVRLPPRGKQARENWLLVKEKDGYADASIDPMREWTKSVVSGRTFDEIAAGNDVWSSKSKAPKRQPRGRAKGVLALPRFRPPQLATLAIEPPDGPDWLHEIKFDGYRVIAATAGGKSRLYTRSGLDWTSRFGGIGASIAQLPMRSALIDGEVVATDEHGRSDFGRLQRALEQRADLLAFYAFDLLEIDGEDITALPLVERKARLQALLGEPPASIHYSDHVVGGGPRFLAECCRMKLEGVVSKRSDHRYVSGRTHAWIKTKCMGRDEFVIGGFRPSDKKGRPFASLLLGEFEGGALRYRGRVGTGFDERALVDLWSRLQPLARVTPPFVDVPNEIRRQARWVEPRLVVEIAYAERTFEGYLRHPIFIGLREDKPASEVSAPSKARGAATRARSKRKS
jgi:bifunctional non-homologous end joining protein LigD